MLDIVRSIDEGDVELLCQRHTENSRTKAIQEHNIRRDTFDSAQFRFEFSWRQDTRNYWGWVFRIQQCAVRRTTLSVNSYTITTRAQRFELMLYNVFVRPCY